MLKKNQKINLSKEEKNGVKKNVMVLYKSNNIIYNFKKNSKQNSSVSFFKKDQKQTSITKKFNYFTNSITSMYNQSPFIQRIVNCGQTIEYYLCPSGIDTTYRKGYVSSNEHGQAIFTYPKGKIICFELTNVQLLSLKNVDFQSSNEYLRSSSLVNYFKHYSLPSYEVGYQARSPFGYLPFQVYKYQSFSNRKRQLQEISPEQYGTAKGKYAVKYNLETYHRSNQDTCLIQKPAVKVGDWIQTGDLLADSASSVGGELAIGHNIIVAYMPWEGYNYEDAILINERLVYEDIYTSIHIERYEVYTKDTKLGSEQITREIPDINENEIRHLDKNGIAKIGSWVEEGDILVGKITPFNLKTLTPQQKLLYKIFDKQLNTTKDSSLRAPKGIKANVINVNILAQQKIEIHNKQKTDKVPIKNKSKTKQLDTDIYITHDAHSSIHTACRMEDEQAKQGDKSKILKQVKNGKTKISIITKLTNTANDYNFTNNFVSKFQFCIFNPLTSISQMLHAQRACIPQSGMDRASLRDTPSEDPLSSDKRIEHLASEMLDRVSLIRDTPSEDPLSSDKRIEHLASEMLDPKLNKKINTPFIECPVKIKKVFKKRKKNRINIKFMSIYLSKIYNGVNKIKNQTKIFKKIKSIHPARGMEGNSFARPSYVHIYLAEKRKMQVGDKMAGRHGNKGIVSRILPRQDMPFLPDGTYVDIVLNPLGVPSRMNVGQIYECLLGLAGRYLGEHYKIPPFDEMYGSDASRSFVLSKLYEARKKTGLKWLFDPNNPGKIRLFDGRNSECFNQTVTVGIAYVLKLVHMVDDKIHMRSTGPYSLVTQQPLRGRSKQGGQRLGEMEVWAIEGYGAAFVLSEMLTIKSDDMTGRQNLWKNLIENKEIALGSPESFKVLVCELQALCLDIGLFRKNSSLGQSHNNLSKIKTHNNSKDLVYSNYKSANSLYSSSQENLNLHINKSNITPNLIEIDSLLHLA